MAKKRYEESSIAAIAEKIRSHTGGDKKYTVAEMADGVDEAAEAAADDKEAVTRALIDRSITEIVIPEGVDEVGNFAFCGCNLVRYIDIPDGLTSIGSQSFNGVGGTYGADGKGPDGEVIIPDSVNVLGTNAFVWSGVRKFVISKNVNFINESTFGGCSKCVLYDFSRHESVPTLKDVNAFNQMPNYNKAKIYVPPELYEEWVVATNWATYADYIVPKASEGLAIAYGNGWGMDAEQYTVMGRGSCTDAFVVVPEKYDDGIHGELEVKDMAYEAFINDNVLTAIYIPKTITEIGTNPISNCPNLKKIYMTGVTALASIHFNYLTALEYVKFGSGLTLIGGGTFSGCAAGAVYDFTACESVPTLDSYGAGQEFGTEPVIKVPASLYEEWKAATNWTLYEDYIVAAE